MHDKERIMSSQDTILMQLHDALPEDCVMTGGTALTRFHGFRHRFSEDIDLFMSNPNSEKVLSWLSLLNGVRAVFHRPHPEKETRRGAVRALREFLNEAGVRHDDI